MSHQDEEASHPNTSSLERIKLDLKVQPRIQKARLMFKEEHLPRYYARTNNINLSVLPHEASKRKMAKIEADLNRSLERNYLKEIVRSKSKEEQLYSPTTKNDTKSMDFSRVSFRKERLKEDFLSFDGFKVNESEVVKVGRRSSIHKRNCGDRNTAEEESTHRVYYDQSAMMDLDQKKQILRKKYAIGTRPIQKKLETRKIFPEEVPKNLRLATDMEDLDNRIFYYRFNRCRKIRENKSLIIQELKDRLKDNKERILSLSVSRDKSDFAKRVMKNPFGAVRSKIVDHIHRKDSAKPQKSADRINHLRNLEKEVNKKGRLVQRDERSIKREAENWYVNHPNKDQIKVIFENPYTQSNKSRFNPEADLHESMKYTAEQKEIDETLEKINKMVAEVFISQNTSTDKGSQGGITITLIRYLSQALRNMDKIRELDSTMQGLYNNLSQISFFRMFRMEDACQIFSWSQFSTWKKGFKNQYHRGSNVMVILSGRMSLNSPGPLLKDARGRVVVESFKMPSVANGVYENVHFTLTDGDYVTPSVFKFMNGRDPSLSNSEKKRNRAFLRRRLPHSADRTHRCAGRLPRKSEQEELLQ